MQKFVLCLYTVILHFHQPHSRNSMWDWSLVECDTHTEGVVPNIWKEHDNFIFRLQQFKNAGNILPWTPHHIPVKVNHQQHCCDIFRSHTMYTFCGTRILYHVWPATGPLLWAIWVHFASSQNVSFQFRMKRCECFLFVKVSRRFSLSSCLLYLKIFKICAITHLYYLPFYLFLW